MMLRRGLAWMNLRFGLVRRVAIAMLVIAIALLLWRFSEYAITREILVSYLVAAGAMIGGAAAIIFTLSIFLLQGVADLYSSKYFQEYATRSQAFVYAAAIAIVLTLFGMALYCASLLELSHRAAFQIVLVSLALIGIVFVLIDWQFEIVCRRVAPASAVAFLNSKATRFLQILQRDARRIAEILAQGGMQRHMARVTAYNRLLQPFIADLDTQIETLLEIALKLADRKEFETAKLAISAAAKALTGYIEARKDSSLAFSSGTVFGAIESDSQSFLSRNLERFNRIGRRFVKEDKDDLAVYVVNAYRLLANSAKDVRYQ